MSASTIFLSFKEGQAEVIKYPNRAEQFLVRGNGDSPNVVLERYDMDEVATSARPASIEELLMYRMVTELASKHAGALGDKQALEMTTNAYAATIHALREEVAATNGYLARANALLGRAGRLIVDLGKEVMEYKEEESKHDEKVDDWSEEVITLTKQLNGLADVPGTGA